MPRIRKKTSKRGTTNQRQKIKKKVSESHRKSKKAARKDKAAGNVHKKSKKDPGIPNDFPYKDQILAEAAQQRREAAEERQRRKEEKRALLGDVSSRPADADALEEDPADAEVLDGVMSLRAAPNVSAVNTTNILEAPMDVTPALPVLPGPPSLREVLNAADVVLHVLDARDPASSLSEILLESVSAKKVALVLNKADTIPQESLSNWLGYLRLKYTVFPVRSASGLLPTDPIPQPFNKKSPKPKIDDAIGLAPIWEMFDAVCSGLSRDELTVALVGVTNSGKSSLMNSLVKAMAVPIYSSASSALARRPHTTCTAQEVVTEIPGSGAKRVKLIDTPGLMFLHAESDQSEREKVRAKDLLLRCRGKLDRLKDPLFCVEHVMALANAQDLMLSYNLPAFTQGDPNALLASMAKVHGLVKKGGVLDHAGAARILLRDWSTGKLVRYTLPTDGPRSNVADVKDEIVNMLSTKKHLRKAGKLIRMTTGPTDTRQVIMDEEWEEESSEEDGGEEEGEEDDDKNGVRVDGEDGDDDEGMSGDEEAAAAEAEEESDSAPEVTAPPAKRKKTVSFAAGSGDSHRRKGGSAGGRKRR
ncbi:hypothetical protein CONPUDRAFT_123380 [Coniophora puteana RWD-64-598 SS2]|uniref:P-loop containing nucleoside triphosphate hydrolase protein n=1 Tax=Coniophora puteana (strain RWD-64-598) TaxID=741705 RepID=A0A5M3MUP8_CONPW|nr:uncharacterized protein CONPUDRAFT_123380 [Coniophora puteana RWD-64-598 SS2]EIW82445.1 hypothetical protein CONPUDRAFT_123380 [Coniophora puteana RWD-64-598 SS2]